MVILGQDRRSLRVGQSVAGHQIGKQLALVAQAVPPVIQALVEGVADFLDQDLDRRGRVGVGQPIGVDVNMLLAIRPVRRIGRSPALQVRVVQRIEHKAEVAALDDRHTQGLGARPERGRIGAGVAERLGDEMQERVRAPGKIAQQAPGALQRQIERTGLADHPRPIVFPGGHCREFPFGMRQYFLTIAIGPEE